MPGTPVYLDHAATTPVLPQVIEAMAAEMAVVGNPSSLHTSGRRARRVVEESREQIAEAMGARPSEVLFTSGGTESDNLAVKGLFHARRDADPRRVRLLVSAVEHHAVLDCVDFLVGHEGPEVTVSGDWQEGDVLHRLPGNAHLLVAGCDGDSLLYLLDAAGVECSTGSACQAGVPQPSHVLLAMGVPEQRARGALRVTLGHTSTDADVDAFLAALPAALERARRAQAASSVGTRT